MEALRERLTGVPRSTWHAATYVPRLYMTRTDALKLLAVAESGSVESCAVRAQRIKGKPQRAIQAPYEQHVHKESRPEHDTQVSRTAETNGHITLLLMR